MGGGLHPPGCISLGLAGLCQLVRCQVLPWAAATLAGPQRPGTDRATGSRIWFRSIIRADKAAAEARGVVWASTNKQLQMPYRSPSLPLSATPAFQFFFVPLRKQPQGEGHLLTSHGRCQEGKREEARTSWAAGLEVGAGWTESADFRKHWTGRQRAQEHRDNPQVCLWTNLTDLWMCPHCSARKQVPRRGAESTS